MKEDFTLYAFNGPVEKRDPNAHPTDPRGVLRFHSNGLTKREYFAVTILTALLYERVGIGLDDAFKRSEAVSDAVNCADALIAKLKEAT